MFYHPDVMPPSTAGVTVIPLQAEAADALLGRLIQRIRKALSVKHIANDDRHGLQIADQTVRGRIEGDYSGADHTPIVVVDGREISWDEFGRMLMTFEGWQFKLEIRDISEEL